MKPTTTLTLEACVHGLAHHIEKVEATDRDAFAFLLEYLVKNPNQAKSYARALSVFVKPRYTENVYQFKRGQAAPGQPQGFTPLTVDAAK